MGFFWGGVLKQRRIEKDPYLKCLCKTFIKGEVNLKKQRGFMRVLMVTLP